MTITSFPIPDKSFNSMSISPRQLDIPTLKFDVINHPVKDTLAIVSSLLSTIILKNDSQYNCMHDPVTLFHSRAVPRISIEAYLTRILQYIPFTNEVLLNVLVFLDRIGGLEGMQLLKGEALPSTSNRPGNMTGTTTTTTITMTKQMDSIKRDPEMYRSESSSLSNSDISFPITQKRGRSDREKEEIENMSDFHNNVKRARTTTQEVATSASSSASSATFIPSTPVSTPPTPSLVSPSSNNSDDNDNENNNNGFRINSFNIHRLLITCVMVAAKFTSDMFYSNARYAKVGGLSLPELNQLELEFLFSTKFELNVKVDELQRVGDALLQFRNRHMIQAVHLQQQLQQQQLQEQQKQNLLLQQQQQLFQLQLQLQMQLQHQQQQQQCLPSYAVPSPTSPNSDSTCVAVSAATAQATNTIVQKLVHQEQKTQLLSPPEEKRTWTETEVHEPPHSQYY
ncbi:hypothetical protein BGZ49_006258 [Haplosporangium sp. Z 27]|nr:hypothetical protein BGZ49_006258 [Haplosporangium sp. Z 27]